jgi:hypothetical protein
MLIFCQKYSISDAAEFEQTLQDSAFGIASNFCAAQFSWPCCSVKQGSKMTDAMESFIASQNIANFKMQLKKEHNPHRRRILLRLLANEVAKHPEAVQRYQATDER